MQKREVPISRQAPRPSIPGRNIDPRIGDFNNRSKSNPTPNKAVKTDPKPPSK